MFKLHTCYMSRNIFTSLNLLSNMIVSFKAKIKTSNGQLNTFGNFITVAICVVELKVAIHLII